MTADVRMWRRQAAVFKRNLLATNRKAFNNFIENINYKENNLKMYRFFSILSNKKLHLKNIRILFRDRDLFSDQRIEKLSHRHNVFRREKELTLGRHREF
ncbi:hypothetical protein CEXT_101571 [Caerostris extrusa]|uniref:Uncharacterized protein n=1 Tax=Caerostris extrusa TaxID=172846 RepID=A0AAV4WJS2_CAEEX|nr:hypothetical protein CEXT_101571 [Caerostris extrusa]